MITYRLSDSLPKHVLENLDHDSDSIKRRNSIEKYLDQGHGSCLLKTPDIANEIIKNWQHFSGIRYDLFAGVVMPNHVHVMIKTNDDWPISKIVWSWKTYISNFIKKGEWGAAQACGAPANNEGTCDAPAKSIWQREYWDRFIRDENHFHSALRYIWENPLKAGLLHKEEKWPFIL